VSGTAAPDRPGAPTLTSPLKRRDPPETQEKTVAATCDVCAKGPSFGHSVSHSHLKTKRRWNPNIQRVRAVVAGTPKRLNVCTSCLKAGKVQRAI
jgi:large subunit ribosomal protein L28